MKEEKVINLDDAWIYYEEEFISSFLSTYYFEYLKNNLNWQNSEIKLFGKTFQTPRLEALYADKNLHYAYSGKKLFRNDFTEELLHIKQHVEEISKFKFNAVLANLYRNGLDSNGWHSDNEKELGKNPIIASLSFGETRKFQIKHQSKKIKMDFQLKHGSLIIMGGEMQHHWLHQIPKQKNIQKERINLTFRYLH